MILIYGATKMVDIKYTQKQLVWLYTKGYLLINIHGYFAYMLNGKEQWTNGNRNKPYRFIPITISPLFFTV